MPVAPLQEKLKPVIIPAPEKEEEKEANDSAAEKKWGKETAVSGAGDGVPGSSASKRNADQDMSALAAPHFQQVSLFAKKPVLIQPKLLVNLPGDIYEKEADAMADKILRIPEKAPVIPVSRISSATGLASAAEEDKETKETGSGTNESVPQDEMILRKSIGNEEEEQLKIQRKETGNGIMTAAGSVEEVLRGTGKPLDKSTLFFMESRFGFDFSKVEVHDYPKAHQSAGEIGALAYTHGHNIVFGAGQFQPGTEKGKKLLAHELTHVIQQASGTVSGNIIHRKAIPDEDKKYEGAGLVYSKAIKANLDGWDLLYKFYNVFLNREIFPGSQPNAYANHVFEAQLFFIKTHPKDWADHGADGILDEKTLNYLLTWAGEYEKNSTDLQQFDGLDIEVLKRLAKIKPTKNPPLQSSYLKDTYQFQLVNDYGFAIEIGSKGDYVTQIQKVLLYLHYEIDETELNVRFGKQTKAALEQFQRDAGLEDKQVDGRFGQRTLRLMDDLLAQKGSILVLPGVYSFVENWLGASPVMYVDGDGDQRKELLLKFGVKGGTILLTVTNIDTKESAGPFSFTADGIEVSKEVKIDQSVATEGIRPLNIRIRNTGKYEGKDPRPEKNIEIQPPGKIKESGAYTIKSGAESYTATFDTSKMKYKKVVSSEIVVEPNTVAADITLGAYNDKFRFTIIKDESQEDEEGDDDGKAAKYHYLLKIAGVGAKNEMVFAKDIPFILEKEWRIYQLVFSKLQEDETSVLFDFDGDGTGDIQVNTIIGQVWDDRQEDKKLPETGRRIVVVLTGPALEEKTERSFSVVNGKFQFREIKTENVFQGAISAQGGTKLKEQKVPENINKEIEGIDNALEQLYQQAVTEGTIRKETYIAYRLLKNGFEMIGPLMDKAEDQLTEDEKTQIGNVASYADVFYELFKEDTKDARKETTSWGTEVSSGDTETNPFTQESVSTTITAGTSPDVSRYELHPGDEIRTHKWTVARRTLRQLRSGFNLWVSEKVKEKYGDKENPSAKITGFYQYMSGLQDIAADPNNKYITRVKAIYYSWDQFLQQPGVNHIELPIYYYLDEDDGEWWVVDFVVPSRPFRRKEDVSDTNKHIVRNDGKTPAPPAELFKKLDHKEHLPKGVLLYDAGEGIEGRIDMTEPWEWKDILGWIGLGLAVIGLAALVVLSDGTATPVAAEIFFALSAIAGGAAAAKDLWDMHKDEGWDVKKAIMDVGQIAASLLTLGTIGAGRLIVLAREAEVGERFTGAWAQLAKFSDMRYMTLLKMTIGTDIINFGLLAEDTITKLNDIDKMSGLDEKARTRAKVFLLAQLLFAGGMTFFSLKGNVAGLERNPTLILHPGPDGVPMVSDARLWLPENLHAADVTDRIAKVAEQRKFPKTAAEDGLNNTESLIQGVKSEGFGQSKNAVPVLESLLSNKGEFEKTARAVTYCQKNGFTHFDVVYTGILNIPDDQMMAVKSALNKHITDNPGFSLKLSDDEIKALIQKGKSLSLSDQEINDFMLIASRDKKPIVATELMTQMDNWKAIQQRGFPYLFADMKAYTDFKAEIKSLLTKYGIPVGDVKVQGSSLRTPGAKDIDMAVFVTDAEFDAMTKKLREGIISRTPDGSKIRKSLIKQLDDGIAEGRINSYLFDRIPGNTQTFNQELYPLNKYLTSTDKGFDLSVMKSSGKFVLNPALNF